MALTIEETTVIMNDHIDKITGLTKWKELPLNKAKIPYFADYDDEDNRKRWLEWYEDENVEDLIAQCSETQRVIEEALQRTKRVKELAEDLKRSLSWENVD